MFITGITKLNKTSIFSELNNLSDVSLSPRFGTLLGYTHEEVETYFDGYLTQSASVLSVSCDELLRSLTKQYDGFCFERTTTKKVFAPWSLLKFFSEPEVGLLDYWFESGGRPAALVQYLKSHTLRDPEEYGKEKSIALNLLTGSANVNTLSDIGLLTQNYLSRFYGILKANDRVLRFLFITGITKLNKTSIFSELNNLSDVSLSPRFGTLLGYTHEEVETYFDGYLTQSASVLSVSCDELLRSLTKQYDGFCFERTTTKKVFAPWSLLKFFSEPEVGLLDYWFESGGRPAALVQYLKSHTLRDPEEYGKEKSIALNLLTGSANVNTLSDIGLLTQAGYLTLKRVVGLTAFVAYPNAEVAAAMAQLYSERLLQGQTLEQVGADNVALRLAEEDPEGVVHLFNRIFTSIDYQNYPVRDEATVRAFIQIFLSGAGFSPHIEVHNSQGRSDLEVTVQNRHFVFEFKVARKEESSEEKLEEGLKQMRKRSYGLQHADQEQLRMVLVFSIPKRKFDKWSVVNPEN